MNWLAGAGLGAFGLYLQEYIPAMLHPAQLVLTARVPDWEKPAREILTVRKNQDNKLQLCRVQPERKNTLILFLPCLIKPIEENSAHEMESFFLNLIGSMKDYSC